MKKLIALAVLVALTTLSAAVAFAHPNIHDGTVAGNADTFVILAAQTDNTIGISVATQKIDPKEEFSIQPAIATSSRKPSNVAIASADTLFQTAASTALAAGTVRGVMTLSDFESEKGFDKSVSISKPSGEGLLADGGSDATASLVSCPVPAGGVTP